MTLTSLKILECEESNPGESFQNNFIKLLLDGALSLHITKTMVALGGVLRPPVSKVLD